MTALADQQGPPARRARANNKAALRYEAILAAAVEVFDERGYAGAGLEGIAKAAGLNKGSLYYYIDTKEDLLFEIMRRGHERGLGFIVESAEEEALDPPERLAAFIRRWTNGQHRNPPELRVMESDYRHLTGERRETIRQMRRTIREVPVRIIADGIDRGYFCPEHDPQLAVHTLFRLLNGPVGLTLNSSEAAWTGVTNWYVHLFVSALILPPGRFDGTDQVEMPRYSAKLS